MLQRMNISDIAAIVTATASVLAALPPLITAIRARRPPRRGPRAAPSRPARSAVPPLPEGRQAREGSYRAGPTVQGSASNLTPARLSASAAFRSSMPTYLRPYDAAAEEHEIAYQALTSSVSVCGWGEIYDAFDPAVRLSVVGAVPCERLPNRAQQRIQPGAFVAPASINGHVGAVFESKIRAHDPPVEDHAQDVHAFAVWQVLDVVTALERDQSFAVLLLGELAERIVVAVSHHRDLFIDAGSEGRTPCLPES